MTTPIEKLSAAALQKREETAQKKVTKALDDAIAAGLGNVRMSEMRKLTDPVAVRYIEAHENLQPFTDERRRRLEYHGSLKPIRSRKTNPLQAGYSEATIRDNISAEVAAGRPVKQATAIAYESARKAWRKRHPTGPLPAHLKQGPKMQFKKGTKAARDHMARLRAMRGKKKKAAKKTTKRNPSESSGQYVVELRATHQYWKSGRFVKNLSDASKYASQSAAKAAIDRLVKSHGRAWNLRKADLMTVKVNPSLSTRRRKGTPETKTRDYVIFKCRGSDVSYLMLFPGRDPRWTSDRTKAVHWTDKRTAQSVANLTAGAMGVASNSTTKAQILAACRPKR